MSYDTKLQDKLFRHLPSASSSVPDFDTKGALARNPSFPHATDIFAQANTKIEAAHAAGEKAVAKHDPDPGHIGKTAAHKAEPKAEPKVEHKGVEHKHEEHKHTASAHQPHHVAHHAHSGHKAHGHDESHVAHAIGPKPTGEAALTAAIGDHMKRHGMGQDAKHHAGELGRVASSYLAETHDNKASLALHKEGSSLASMYVPGSHKPSAGDPPMISTETLAYVKEHGVPSAGLNLTRAALASETRGLSDLDLMERMGPKVLETIGERGVNVTQLNTVHDHIQDSLKGTGFEHQASKLDALRTMTEMAAGEKNYLVVDSEKGVKGATSLADAQKHSVEHTDRTVVAVELTDIKKELGMAAAPREVPVEDHSFNAKAFGRHEVPVEDRSVNASSIIAKHQVPVEEKSFMAAPKHEVPVVERSTQAHAPKQDHGREM